MSTTIEVDGNKLRAIIAEAGGKRQKAIAKAVGVTHFAVSRWLSPGTHTLRMDNLTAVASAIGLNPSEVVTRCAVNMPGDRACQGLSEAEREWLVVFQSLKPLMQARARIAVEEFLNEKKK